jgi:hypothetical protein
MLNFKLRKMKTHGVKSIRHFTTLLVVITMVFASCSGQNKTAEKELMKSAEPEQKVDPPGMDIHMATVLGDLDVIEQHIQAGSDLDKKDDYGSTALITATVFGKTEVALALIEGGADVNIQNNDGSTPLYCAAFFCRTEVIEALLEKGADKSIRNNFGSTPLESVSGPFSEVKGIYDLFNKDLGPLGLKLDYGRLEDTRPVVAEMLR